MLYDVSILNDKGAWQTDLTSGSLRRCLDRRDYLARYTAVKVENMYGDAVE